MLKNEKIRLAAFIVALCCAVFFISKGIYALTNQKPGFYEIAAKGDDAAPTYAKGIKLTYLCEGKSNEIKTLKNEIEGAYSTALLRAYMLTDPNNEYEGINNLCTLNKNPGKDITVSTELYDILMDACGKTEDNKGFSLFFGSYYSHWNTILSLTEPSDFDPLFNFDEKERLETLFEKTESYEDISFTFKDNNVVALNVPGDYLDFLNENEESTNIVDLNVLRESYMLDMVKGALAARGFDKGLLTTDRGLLSDLGTYDCGGYSVYSIKDGKLSYEDTVKIPKGGCMSGICALPFEEDTFMYYTVNKDGKIYYRTPFVELCPDGFCGDVKCSYVYSDSENIYDVMYKNFMVNSGYGIEGDGIIIYK